MARSPFRMVNALVYSLLTFSLAQGQTQYAAPTSSAGGAQASSANGAQASPAPTTAPSATIGTVTIDGTVSTYSVQFTVPAAAGNGANVLPNILDPNATDAQTVCPGYKASNVVRNAHGFSATLNLAGEPCNVYGTDIETLNLTVQYQSADRLNINIQPAYIVSRPSNYHLYLFHDSQA